MNKDLATRLLTLLVIAGALGLVIARRSGSPTQPAAAAAPRDTIFAMLEAVRTGDVRAYLRSYTGQMEANLNQILREKEADGFKKYLQTVNAELKGVALQEPRFVSADEVEVRVEYVYQDRNETQTMFLEKRPEGWKIGRVESAERIKTLVPYGTPVQ